MCVWVCVCVMCVLCVSYFYHCIIMELESVNKHLTIHQITHSNTIPAWQKIHLIFSSGSQSFSNIMI